MAEAVKIDPGEWAEALRTARKRRPLIFAVTNFVAASFQANAILAIGGSPVMSPCIHESEDLAGNAEGVLINTGTPFGDRERLIGSALSAAGARGRITLLDPVGYGATAYRKELVDALLRKFRFSVIKGNKGEITFLAGEKAEMKGVDSEGEYVFIGRTVKKLAAKTGAFVCATGVIDVLSDGETVLCVRGGSPWLGRIAGGGCALGAMMLALSAGGDVYAGTLCASVLLRRAAERAEKNSNGPGTFQANLLDALYETQPDDMFHEAWRVEEVCECTESNG